MREPEDTWYSRYGSKSWLEGKPLLREENLATVKYLEKNFREGENIGELNMERFDSFDAHASYNTSCKASDWSIFQE